MNDKFRSPLNRQNAFDLSTITQIEHNMAPINIIFTSGIMKFPNKAKNSKFLVINPVSIHYKYMVNISRTDLHLLTPKSIHLYNTNMGTSRSTRIE